MANFQKEPVAGTALTSFWSRPHSRGIEPPTSQRPTGPNLRYWKTKKTSTGLSKPSLLNPLTGWGSRTRALNQNGTGPMEPLSIRNSGRPGNRMTLPTIRMAKILQPFSPDHPSRTCRLPGSSPSSSNGTNQAITRAHSDDRSNGSPSLLKISKSPFSRRAPATSEARVSWSFLNPSPGMRLQPSPQPPGDTSPSLPHKLKGTG